MPYSASRLRAEAFNLFVLVAGLFVLLAVLNAFRLLGLAAGITIGVLFATIAALVGAIHFYAHGYFWGVLVGLGFVVGVLSWPRGSFPQRVPSLEPYYELNDTVVTHHVPVSADEMAGRNKPCLLSYDVIRRLPHRPEDEKGTGVFAQLDDADVLCRWAGQFCGKPAPLVLVTTSGGASVSAVFTLTFLTELENRRPGGSRYIRLITGASGGMLGAAYFRARRAEFDGRRDADRNELIREMRAEICGDFLSPVVQETVFMDFPRVFFCPSGSTRDRGTQLELAWRAGLHRKDPKTGTRSPALDLTFKDLRGERAVGPNGAAKWDAAGEGSGQEPSLIFSPMMVEDGRPLLISTLDLNPLLDQKWADVPGQDAKHQIRTAQAVELFKLFPKAGAGLKLSTAVRLNAAFPFLTPAAVLPCLPPRRVVDAGYYDNHGVDVAAAWLMANKSTIEMLVNCGAISRVVLIEVRPYLRLDGSSRDGRPGDALVPPLTQAETDVLAAAEKDEYPWPRPWFAYNELTTPLYGGGAALRSSMVFRQATQIKQIEKRFHEEKLPFERLAFIGNLDASLNWYLPKKQIEEIELGLRPIDKETYDLLKQNGTPPSIRGDLAQKTSFRQALQWNHEQFARLLELLKVE